MNHVFARLHLRLRELGRDEQGQDLIEYALIASFMVLVCISSVRPLAVYVNGIFANVSSSLA
jgi:Flp pilus assembly pilin Flp